MPNGIGVSGEMNKLKLKLNENFWFRARVIVVRGDFVNNLTIYYLLWGYIRAGNDFRIDIDVDHIGNSKN